MDKELLAAGQRPSASLGERFANALPLRRAAHAPVDDAEHFGAMGLAAALALLAFASWLVLRDPALPQPRDASAPRTAFSSGRAFAHVQALAQAPRPLASAANAQARGYIVEQVRALGLVPEVQAATVQKATDYGFHNVHVTLAVVHNVVVRVPGVAPGHETQPALLLASHYDSDRTSLGAADGGASVAAMLETLRALKAGTPPQYDTIFLFADGERLGAFGTQAFVDQHPLARRVGLALRFDNAGNRGPLVLADTSRASGDAIAGWASAAPHPRGSSFTREAYALRPNALRIGPLARLDAPVLQFANLEGDTGVADTPDRLERGMLQDEGDTMLALVREFSGTPLARDDAQAGQVYAALAPLGVIHYPARMVWPLTRLACLLLVGVCCLAAQRAGVDSIRLIQGTFAFALFAFLLVLGLWLLWIDNPAFRRAAQLMAGAHSLRLLAGVLAVSGALFVAMQRRLQCAIGMPAAALGALVCVAIALAGVSWAAPGTSVLLAWPLLAALGALAALHSHRVARLPRAARLAIVLAAALPALVLLAPELRDAAAVQPPGLPLALIALVLGLAVMPLASLARRFTVRALLAAGLACLGSAAGATPHPVTPQPSPLVYYHDMPTWRSWWLARTPTLDDGTRKLFPDLPAPRRLMEVFGWDSDDIWYAPAPRTGVAFPDSIMTLSDDTPARRHVEFDLVSKNRAPEIALSISGGKPLRATVNGRVLSDEEDFSLSISLYGMEDQPLHFGIDVQGDPIVRIRVEERIPGLPPGALPPEVAAAQRKYLPMTSMTVAADELRFR